MPSQSSQKLVLKYWPDPCLLVKCKDVVDWTELPDIAAQMIKIMQSKGGIGLAATQVGLDIRIFVARTDYRTDEVKAFVNPTIISHEEHTHIDTEGCLSVPGVGARVRRFMTVTVEAASIDSPERIATIHTGTLARCVQHEMDHLDGIMFFDRIPKVMRQLVLGNYYKVRNR